MPVELDEAVGDRDQRPRVDVAVLTGTVGGGDDYLIWAVFAALVVSGVITVIQDVRLGRIGSGCILLVGSSGAYLAICVAALRTGAVLRDDNPRVPRAHERT